MCYKCQLHRVRHCWDFTSFPPRSKGARQFLFFFFVALSFLIFARVSLEDRIIADSFGRVIHGEHVKHRVLNSYKPPLSESEGICAECRCGLSTMTEQCITAYSGTASTSSGNSASGVESCCLHLLLVSVCLGGNGEPPFPYYFGGRPSCHALSLPSAKPHWVSACLFSWKGGHCLPCKWIFESD